MNAQSNDKQKSKSKELVVQYFLVFLKCTLEKGLGGVQQRCQEKQAERAAFPHHDPQ